MKLTLALGTRLLKHALWSFGEMGVDKDVRCARRILSRFERERLTTVTQREVNEWVKGTFKPVTVVEKGLRILVDKGYLIEEPGDGTRRRVFKVNQAIYNE